MAEDQRTLLRPTHGPSAERARPTTANGDPDLSQSTLKQRFVLQEKIAAGGMGIVYKAVDLRRQEARDREQYVAIKVIGQVFLEKFPDAFISLQREARKAQQLAHPNIVTVYDFDRDGDTVFMTMEWLQGQSLEALLDAQHGAPLSLERAFAIIQEVGKGLSYAHSKGVVHSDIKPGNIFITQSNEVKILDFGIATAVARNDGDTTATVYNPRNLGVLTTAYAPPEMFYGAAADPRDDVYSLAVVCYELLAGRHPFDKLSTLDAVQHQRKPAKIRRLSQSQWKALLAALAFQRDQRTASVALFVTALTAQRRASKPLLLGAAMAGILGLAIVSALKIAPWVHSGGAGNTVGPPPAQLSAPDHPQQPLTPALKKAPVAPVSNSQPPLRLSLTPSASHYTPGASLWFYASTSETAYLHCYYNNEQQLVRIFPNRFHPDAKIPAGETIEIPNMNRSQGFDIVLDHPVGADTIVCFATRNDQSQALPKSLWLADLTPIEGYSLPEITAEYRKRQPDTAISHLPIAMQAATP